MIPMLQRKNLCLEKLVFLMLLMRRLIGSLAQEPKVPEAKGGAVERCPVTLHHAICLSSLIHFPSETVF